MSKQILNVIDEEGNVLRQESRAKIHKEGLLHADVHVWFYTPDGKLIFQHRSHTKDFLPDLLDVTVGGHVEIGDTYEQTALKEAREETGIVVEPEELTFLRSTLTKVFDEATGTTGHHLRRVYAYCYAGKVADLRTEEGEALGFEAWPIDRLLALSEEEKSSFTPWNQTEEGIEIIKQIKALI